MTGTERSCRNDRGTRVSLFPKSVATSNVSIFKQMGTAMEQEASRDIKVLVVGNPANTNCLICSHFAPSIPKKNFSALTRLDHNRAKGQIALRAGARLTDVKNVIIWGNHSSTQYPDVTQGTIAGRPIEQTLLRDKGWLKSDFIKMIQKRGAAIISARKASSALSAGRAITNHMHDWFVGRRNKRDHMHDWLLSHISRKSY